MCACVCMYIYVTVVCPCVCYPCVCMSFSLWVSKKHALNFIFITERTEGDREVDPEELKLAGSNLSKEERVHEEVRG